jgi:hypothetical protein
LFPRAAPDRFGCFSLVYESGAFPSYVLGCGSRLIPTTVPWPAKFAWPAQSRRAHACPMTPTWRLVTLVDADAIDMRFSTKRRLAWPRGEVNDLLDGEVITPHHRRAHDRRNYTRLKHSRERSHERDARVDCRTCVQLARE